MPNNVLIDGGEILLNTSIDGGEVTLNDAIDGGETGASFQPLPHISIGEVETLPAGSEATATMTGTASQPVLNLGLVQGAKGETGDTGATGASAGFGTVTATVDNNVGTPSVDVTTSGADTAKNFAFAFHNLKGEGSVRSVNNQTGDVVLDAEDVGALPDDTDIPTKISDLTNDMVYDLGTPTFNTDGSFNLTQEQHTAIMQMWNKGLCAVTITVDGMKYWAIKEGVFTLDGMTFNSFIGSWAAIKQNLPVSGTVAVGVMPTMPIGGFFYSTDLTSLEVYDWIDYAVQYNSPVKSVNTQTGQVVLTASDVGALPDTTVIPSKVSDLTNDSEFLTLSTLPIWDGSVT